jgi:hypothetical protein
VASKSPAATHGRRRRFASGIIVSDWRMPAFIIV